MAKPDSRRERSSSGKGPPRTPDGRYIVVRGRLWRAANPGVAEEVRQQAVHALMAARRAVRGAIKREDGDALTTARAAVEAAKRQLGERGPPWWRDGAPDLNRRLVRNSPYAAWYVASSDKAEGTG